MPIEIENENNNLIAQRELIFLFLIFLINITPCLNTLNPKNVHKIIILFSNQITLKIDTRNDYFAQVLYDTSKTSPSEVRLNGYSENLDRGRIEVDNKVIGKIDQGLVLLVGFTEGDNQEKIEYLAKKVVNLRIFDDENGVMNKSLLEHGGDILSISQFTLYADTHKGNRPSYIQAMKGEESTKLYDAFNEELRKYCHVETGKFGADMKVSITNQGPVTIQLER